MQGTNGPVTLSGVVPRTGLVDRELDVTVIGNGTTFDASSAVDFGPGVTVSSVAVISPTAIAAHLQIDKGTTIGPRDVTVQTGGSSLAAHNAFSVAGDIDVTLGLGTAVQGGIIQLTAKDNDQMDFGMGMQSQAIGTFASLGYGDGFVQTGTRASFVTFVDPLAPVGPGAAEVANLALSLDGAVFFPETFLSAADAIGIAARAPTALPVNGVLATENIGSPYSTQLYKTSTTDSGLLFVWVASSGSKIHPRLNVYPTSGKSQDFIDSDDPMAIAALQFPVVGNADTYSVVSDEMFGGGASSSYGFRIGTSLLVADVVGAEQSGDHSTAATAQNLDESCSGWSKLCMVTGHVDSERQRDVYQLPTFGSPQWLDTFAIAGATCTSGSRGSTSTNRRSSPSDRICRRAGRLT